MRIFLTGGTGVVGRRLIPLLRAEGHEVSALARSEGSATALRARGADPVRVNLFDADALAAAFSGHQAVVNLATAVPPTSRVFLPGAWREMAHIRRDGSRAVAAAARAAGAERLIQESFAPLYADGGERWLDEDSPLRPARYNRAALDAEASAARFSEGGGVGVVLRFGYFYGPDPGGATLDLIRFVRRGWAPWMGSPEGFISSLSHDDAAGAAVAALRAPAGVYNVVDDEPVRRREYFNSLADLLGVSPPRFFPAWVARLAGSVGETMARSLRISNRRFRDATAWQPRYRSVREGWPALVAEAGLT